jgi:hypothetical protein
MDNEQVINKLFTALTGIYPAWKAAYPTMENLNEAKRQWLIAFKDEELDRWEYVERGLKEARQDTNRFLPSVGQFIDWCRWNEQRDNPVWFLERVNKEQKNMILAERKKQGLPCGKYDTLTIEDLSKCQN